MIVNSHGENPKDVARRFGKLACLKLLGGDTGTYYLMMMIIIIIIIIIIFLWVLWVFLELLLLPFLQCSRKLAWTRQFKEDQ